MREEDIDQVAEIAGAAKQLFKAFEDQLGEVMASQRLASKEANEAFADTRRALQQLLHRAKEASDGVRKSQEDLFRGWQAHVTENSKAAGGEMARKFGEDIAKGLEKRLAELAEQVEVATRRLTWKSILSWALGIAIAIPLTVDIGIRAFMPSVEDMTIPGLSVAQTHDVLTRIHLCWPDPRKQQDSHVCVVTDDPPHITRDPWEKPAVIARGM
jgi:hypothetical protein